MKWLYHYLAWQFFGGSYRQHQCPHMHKRKDRLGHPYHMACIRAKGHYGKHTYWPHGEG